MERVEPGAKGDKKSHHGIWRHPETGQRQPLPAPLRSPRAPCVLPALRLLLSSTSPAQSVTGSKRQRCRDQGR